MLERIYQLPYVGEGMHVTTRLIKIQTVFIFKVTTCYASAISVPLLVGRGLQLVLIPFRMWQVCSGIVTGKWKEGQEESDVAELPVMRSSIRGYAVDLSQQSPS